ncbi:MAG: MFS transporter, partial [Oxalobacter sp.]|nr:MFS transporter [Oxalobacter sp.]
MATEEKYPNRVIQLFLGITCMATVANCQYGWTLFVGPIEDKYHWARAAIQLSFTIFLIFETWLVPLEGWGVDKFGPRPVIIFGAILVTIGWIIFSIASSLGVLYAAQVLTGAGAGAVYGTCSGNSLKWFPDKRGLA